MRIGIDVGSTTVKVVVIDLENQIHYQKYHRHHSKINKSLLVCLEDIQNQFSDSEFQIAITGSAGMGLAEKFNIDFIQEVYATKLATDVYRPETDVVIELGGEDAKILFLSNGLEVRMNGSCAGGTGAFIDQIATLLAVTPEEMNERSKQAQNVYPIASRCGVFAKSDIQPLLNQGANIEDLSLSIFQSVVNQTITGLAQGRAIKGNVLYLGGPLTFMSELRSTFDKSLNLTGTCPEHGLYYVALGCAISAKKALKISTLIQHLNSRSISVGYKKTKPLFSSDSDYEAFKTRHERSYVKTSPDKTYSGNAYLGVDAGSTTIKLVVVNEENDILFSEYRSNGGKPVDHVKSFLSNFYKAYPKVTLCASTVTGYGEDLVKCAFNMDYGVVETIAHYTAAKAFNENVDFIIDIGGQDIKCFRISENGIEDLFLNEACSSGCGSFLQSFAEVLDYDIETFATIGLIADAPVDLGSRCTVFMNSSVKQAQKDGATVENISAGLSISVVKNAVYKVIRASKASALGKNIVVQGGTFLNDAVLRAFELEIGSDVTRPNISGLMGAYGAALYGKEKGITHSSVLNKSELEALTYKTSWNRCRLCENSCKLTVSVFDHDRKFISGNRCDRPVKRKNLMDLNLVNFKQHLLKLYMNRSVKHSKGTIGIPMVLNNYELLPFWTVFFEALGYEVVTSDFSNESTYEKGQHTIPSDTVCFPAKLVHGHIEVLLEKDADVIFYPCMTYNVDESRGDNNYNCPVVAYYPENVVNNIQLVNQFKFINDYIGIHRPKDFPKKMTNILSKYLKGIRLRDVKLAMVKAFDEYYAYLSKVSLHGKSIIKEARAKDKQIIVLAGRPYHLDPKVNHGIDRLISSFDVAIVTEDALHGSLEKKTEVDVLNQWTYHSRLYDAAQYVTTQNDMSFVQLVSFGCGVDAITTDEISAILRDKNKIYTQLKIDEISNLGAAKIRVRSLLAAIDREN